MARGGLEIEGGGCTLRIGAMVGDESRLSSVGMHWVTGSGKGRRGVEGRTKLSWPLDCRGQRLSRVRLEDPRRIGPEKTFAG